MAKHEVGGRTARVVLFVLVLVYVVNFIDRQILSILAEEIKGDLGITDAQMAFLYGTAFAVFYAVFGIPLGRLADVWVRRSLIGVGLAFWSAMTALSGTARSFAPLAVFRIGVAVGEASASPAAYSLLSDWFPPKRRATALSIYSSGVYIGGGIGLFLGGFILDSWNAAFPAGTAPFGLAGWQAAFFAVGLPGLLLAVLVRMLPEPLRGQSDGIPERAPHPEPFRAFAAELLAVVPPLTLVSLSRNGASARAIAGNLAVAAALVSAVTALSSALGDGMQWLALGVGLYAAVSWAQGLALRDPPAFAMIFKNPALLLASTGFAFAAFVGYGVGFWAAPFFIRVHGVSATEAGTALGLAGAAGGWLGVTLGGLISDPWKRTNPNARLWMGIAAAALGAPAAVLVLSTSNLTLAYGVTFLWNVVGAMWIGPAATTANELVLPRMRAMASAFYLLLLTFIGLALGPYTLGRLSDALAARSGDPAEGLRSALRIGVGFYGLAIAFLLAAMRFVPQAEATRLERARAAGEPE